METAVPKRFVYYSDPGAYCQLLVLIFWDWMVLKALANVYAERFAHIILYFTRCVAEIVGGVLPLEETDARDSERSREAIKH